MNTDVKWYGRSLVALITAPILILGLIILSASRVEPVHAAAIVVDSTADTQANDGACTLREAVINANNDDQSGSTDCTAGSGADTITFSVAGTIALGSTLPGITGEMMVDGAGSEVAFSGQNSVQVLVVANSGALTLNAVTIADGNTTGNGGAIDNQGTLTVTSSTFTGNNAMYGGAVSNDGVLTLSNSTFSANSAFYGGAIINWPRASAEMVNSTLTENSASVIGGGVYNAWLNGVGGTMILVNTLLAGNTDDATGTNGDCANSGGTFIVDGFNIDSDGSCPDATTFTLAQINLGPLADNGGPTRTYALLEGSTAIDFADNSRCPATDQRDVSRPQGRGCDVGSFELETTTFTLHLPVIKRN